MNMDQPDPGSHMAHLLSEAAESCNEGAHLMTFSPWIRLVLEQNDVFESVVPPCK